MDFLRSAPLRCLPWNPGRFECGHGNSPIFLSSPKIAVWVLLDLERDFAKEVVSNNSA